MSEAAILDSTMITAMRELGVDGRAAQAEAALRSTSLYLGETVIGNQSGPTFRAYAGPESITEPGEAHPGRGGWRIWMYDGTFATAQIGAATLSTSMQKKFGMRELPYRGAKAVTMLDARGWAIEQKIDASRQLMRMMHDYEDDQSDNRPLDNHLIDGIAGDLFTNNCRIMDAATDQVAEQNPNYDYAWALATGKSLEHGGNAFRPEATGFGLFVALRERMRQRGEGHATIAIQGAGAVGIWLAHHAQFSRRNGDPIIDVAAMSDIDGMVHTERPGGLIIPYNTARQLGDAAYTGPKTTRIAAEAEQSGMRVAHRTEDNQRNILTFPVDYVAPCAKPGTINKDTVPTLGARRGSLGGANNDTTQEAYEWNRAHRPDFEELTGEVVNSEGTHVSIIEREANISTVDQKENTMPDRTTTMAISEAGMVGLMDKRNRMAKELETNDGRLMAAGLVVAHMFPGTVDLSDKILAGEARQAA